MDRYTLVPEFRKLIPQFLAKENVFGMYVEESSTAGDEISKALQEKGYQAVKVEQETPASVNVLCIAASPKAALEKIKSSAGQKIWLEPGSESREAISYCRENKIDLIYYHSLIKEVVSRK